MNILFLPNCLRNLDYCSNKYNENGLICKGEHDCSVGRLKAYAEDLDYNVFIAPGGSFVEKICREQKPESITGVACQKEISLARQFLDGNGYYRSIELLVDGCLNTKVDENRVKEVLNASPQI